VTVMECFSKLEAHRGQTSDLSNVTHRSISAATWEISVRRARVLNRLRYPYGGLDPWTIASRNSDG